MLSTRYSFIFPYRKNVNIDYLIHYVWQWWVIIAHARGPRAYHLTHMVFAVAFWSLIILMVAYFTCCCFGYCCPGHRFFSFTFSQMGARDC